MMGDLFAMLNDKGLNISNSPISAKDFAELVQAIKSGEISGRIAKEVFEIMIESGDSPKKIIETKGLKQQSDPKELEKMINEILANNKDKVDQYKSGKEIDQETRLFDTKKNETRSMRSKEDAHDYRYFPDPDLLPLKLDQKLVDDLKKSLPELPDKKKERFIKDYGLNAYEANVLVSEKEISDYYEEVAKLSDNKLAATWMMGDLFAMLNDKGLNISNSPISAKDFAELVQAIKSGEISGRIAKEVFEIMIESGDNPKKIIETKGLKQQSDPKELEKMINEILAKNKDKVDQYKSGKEKLFGFFVGQVMKSSGGKANPQLTNEILKKLLKG